MCDLLTDYAVFLDNDDIAGDCDSIAEFCICGGGEKYGLVKYREK